MRVSHVPAVLTALCVACGGSQSRESGAGAAGGGDTLTQRQRDSALAESRIPGARGVGRAMRAADSISARVRATDTLAR